MDEKNQKAFYELFEIPGKLYLMSEDLQAVSYSLDEVKDNLSNENESHKIKGLKAYLDIINKLLFYTFTVLNKMSETAIRSQDSLWQLLPYEQEGSTYEH